MASGAGGRGERVLLLRRCAAIATLLIGFALQRAVSQTAFLPIQSKSPQSLGSAMLLVASRDLTDPHFAETVILLVHYDADNVLGLIVNRRTKVPLSEAFETLQAAKGRADSVYTGGPVDPSSVFALRRSTEKLDGATSVFGTVYFITGKTLFEKTIGSRPDPADFRVYLGYTGWTNAQLRKEVEVGAWFLFRADAGAIFDGDPDSLWSRLIRRTEQKFARFPSAVRHGQVFEIERAP